MGDEQTQNQEGGDKGLMPSMPFSSPIHPQFGAFLLGNDNELNYIEHFLNGDEPEFDSDKDEVKWHKKMHAAVVNEQGVYEIMRFLRGISSKLVSTSRSDQRQFRNALLDNVFSMTTFLYQNHRRFDLKPHSFDLLATELANYIEYSLAKARGGHMANLISPQVGGVAYPQGEGNQPQQRKSGLLSFLGF